VVSGTADANRLIKYKIKLAAENIMYVGQTRIFKGLPLNINY
jgi:hypothetical protein